MSRTPIDPFESRYDSEESIGGDFDLDLSQTLLSLPGASRASIKDLPGVENLKFSDLAKLTKIDKSTLADMFDVSLKTAASLPLKSIPGLADSPLAQVPGLSNVTLNDLASLTKADPVKLAKSVGQAVKNLPAAISNVSAGGALAAATAAVSLLRGNRPPTQLELDAARITGHPGVVAALAAVSLVPGVGPIIAGFAGLVFALVGPVAEGLEDINDAYFSLTTGGSAKDLAISKAVQRWKGQVPEPLNNQQALWATRGRTVYPNVIDEPGALAKAHKKWEQELADYEQYLRGEYGKEKSLQAVGEFTAKLAPLVGAADGGEAKAIKALTGVRVVLSKDLAEARGSLRAITDGFAATNAKAALKVWPEWDQILKLSKGQARIKALGSAGEKLQAKAKNAYAQALAETKKRVKVPAPKPDDRKVEAALKKAAELLKTRAKEAQKKAKDEGKTWLFVDLYSRVSRSQYEQVSSGGTVGTAITSSGRPVFGRFRKS